MITDKQKEEEESVSQQTPIIPIINIDTVVSIQPLLQQTLRSQSFELPRDNKQQEGIHAHFDKEASIIRPAINRASISHSEGTNLRRPSIHSRKSFPTSVSSISLYSHFAGEDFTSYHDPTSEHRKPSKKFSLENIDLEKKKTGKNTADANNEIISVTDDSSSIDDVGSYKEDDVSSNESSSSPKASVGKAMFMFLKAFIGSGVLFLPKAFQHGGLALSIVLMIVIALICLFAFLRLVRTQQIIGGSYGDIGGILFGQAVRFTVLFFIVISQIGFVCSYFIFVSGNLVSVADVLSKCTAGIDQKYYIWIPLIILTPLALVRHIARLSFTAIIADILILFGLICTLYFTANHLSNFGVGPNVAAVNPTNFALMIGTATFSFEGIGLIIPIVESMQRPEKFPFVLTLGMMIVCVIYILIGTISYLAYGDTVQAAVIYNFPPDNKLTITVKLLYSLAICLTAPLMLFPALKIIENGLFYKLRSGRDSIRVKWSKNIYRIILSILCAAVAFGIGGDNLDKFVSLVGSVACVPLCFIFPGMFHLKVSKKPMDVTLNIALMIFGVGILVYTLYVSIDSFINPLTELALGLYCPVVK